MWFPLICPLLGTWPTTQACALSGNRTSNPLVCRPALNPLTRTSQGYLATFEDEVQRTLKCFSFGGITLEARTLGPEAVLTPSSATEEHLKAKEKRLTEQPTRCLNPKAKQCIS